MPRYEATFEANSKADARAVRLLVQSIHDTLREEVQGVDRHGETRETLDTVEAIREATRDLSPGSLTVAYESADEPFEE